MKKAAEEKNKIKKRGKKKRGGEKNKEKIKINKEKK